MEPHVIFKVANHLLYKVNWEDNADYGWIYCGVSNDLKRDLVEETINEHFTSNKVYLAISRKLSCEINITKVLEAVIKNIDEGNFSIWSQDFKRVLEFNKIGIFRKGTVATNARIEENL